MDDVPGGGQSSVARIQAKMKFESGRRRILGERRFVLLVVVWRHGMSSGRKRVRTGTEQSPKGHDSQCKQWDC